MSIDVAAFQVATPEFLQILATTDNNGQTVIGPAKLAQRFTLELMTDKNDVAQSNQGCDFVARLLSGIISETDVFLALHSSLGDVVNLIQSAALTTDPDDEQLAGISVVRLAIAESDLQLDLQLRTKSNELITINLPLRFILG